MKVWAIRGADRNSGVDCSAEVEAETEAEAVKAVGGRMLVMSAKVLKPPKPPPLPKPARPAAPTSAASHVVGGAVAAAMGLPVAVVGGLLVGEAGVAVGICMLFGGFFWCAAGRLGQAVERDKRE